MVNGGDDGYDNGYDPTEGVDWEKPVTRAIDRSRRSLRSVGVDERAVNPDPTHQLLEGYTGGYSPHNFYTRASDSKGHSHNVQVNFPSQFGQILAEVKEKYPEYTSNASVLRDAVMHLVVMRAAQLEEGVTEAWVTAHYDGLIEAKKEAMRAKKALVTNMESACEMAEEQQDWKQLDKVLGDIEEYLATSDPDQNPYYEEAKGLFMKVSERQRRRKR